MARGLDGIHTFNLAPSSSKLCSVFLSLVDRHVSKMAAAPYFNVLA